MASDTTATTATTAADTTTLQTETVTHADRSTTSTELRTNEFGQEELRAEDHDRLATAEDTDSDESDVERKREDIGNLADLADDLRHKANDILEISDETQRNDGIQCQDIVPNQEANESMVAEADDLSETAAVVAEPYSPVTSAHDHPGIVDPGVLLGFGMVAAAAAANRIVDSARTLAEPGHEPKHKATDEANDATRAPGESGYQPRHKDRYSVTNDLTGAIRDATRRRPGNRDGAEE